MLDLKIEDDVLKLDMATLDAVNMTAEPGGGIVDYNLLNNKPEINGHVLVGDQTFDDLGLAETYAKKTYVNAEINIVKGEIDELAGDVDDLEQAIADLPDTFVEWADVDESLNSTSGNPIANKTVTHVLDRINQDIAAKATAYTIHAQNVTQNAPYSFTIPTAEYNAVSGAITRGEDFAVYLHIALTPGNEEVLAGFYNAEGSVFSYSYWAFTMTTQSNLLGLVTNYALAIDKTTASGALAKASIDTEAIVTRSTLEIALATKQDVLTFDTAPTENSDNPVTSNGIYEAIEAVEGQIVPQVNSDWNASSGVAEILNKPTIGNATLTIQKNATTVDTFTANATANKTINITVPTTASDVNALPSSTKYGASITVSIDSTDYKITTTLKDQDGNTLGTAQVIDLPLESVVVNGTYDAQNKKIVLTLENGNTIDIPVGDLVAGLQTEITAQSPLNADLVDDSTSTHKFTTAANLTKLAGIEAGAEVNVQPDWDQTTDTADDFIKNKPTKTSDFTNDGADGSAAYLETDETAYRATSIPFGQVDSTSTATVYTATVPGITALRDGVCMWLRNGVVTSKANFTLNINGLGAKPVYSNMADASRESTMFNIAYTFLFVYDEDRVAGGCWMLDRGYDSNTNTIGYQLRTNSTVRKTTDKWRYYKILFSSADNTHWVPANTDTANNATTAKVVNQRPINPFGMIVYSSATTNYAAEADISATTIWEQYLLTLGFSFNRTGAALTLTAQYPVYVKCAPQANGSAIMDADEPIVQALPSTDDGEIYIYLGTAVNATQIELVPEHPVYWYKNGAVRLWTNLPIWDGGVT